MSIVNDVARIYLLGFIAGRKKYRDDIDTNMTDQKIKNYMADCYSNDTWEKESFASIIEYMNGPESQIEKLLLG